MFVLTPNGSLARWEINKTELNLTESITANFCTHVVRQAYQAFNIKDIDPSVEPRNVGLTVMAGLQCVVSLPIRKIPMSAPFAVQGNRMWPEFDQKHPVIRLDWVVPDNMILVLAVHIDSGMQVIDHHLVAFDHATRAFRLPISNLYADCRLCSGRFNNVGVSVLDCCRRAWQQFHVSPWNADLYGDSKAERRAATKEMFSYQVDNANITQKPFAGDWTTLCEKVATDHITKNIIPV